MGLIDSLVLKADIKRRVTQYRHGDKPMPTIEDIIDEQPTIETGPYMEFCEWVAEEIFGDEGDYWEKVQDAFPELACRRLNKLGIVHKEGDKWLWVDRKELENG